jgi:hypothetical protein
VSCVGPRPPFLQLIFLITTTIIISQIIGIVYSAKLVPIDENLLYTKENHFTGSLYVFIEFVHACFMTISVRICALLGWLDCGHL